MSISISKKTILLVEDEALIAMNEAAILKKYGYHVIIASTAQKAVDTVLQEDIDLVLMDIDLGRGKMDGTETAEFILKDHELPIVFLTSHSEKEYVGRVKNITGYGYVLKNSGEFVLVESINMAFGLFEAHQKLKHENKKRKDIEERLREEQAELSAIYKHTPVVMIIVDKEHRVRKANAFSTEFAGAQAEDLIGKRGGEAFRCVHHIDDPRGCGFGPYCEECKVRRTVTATFERKKSFKKLEATLPFSIRGKETAMTFLLSTSYLEIKGEPFVIISIEDITDRKKLENELHLKAKELENITVNLIDLAALTDLEGNFEFVGKSHEILGYDSADLVGSNVMDLVHPEDYLYIKEEFSNFLQIKTPRKVEYRYRCADGTYLWFETQGKILTDDNENPKQIIFNTRDITDRKHAEKSLKESEEKYRLITENVSDIIVQVDAQSKPIYISPSATETLGYVYEDVCGHRMLDFIPPDDRKETEMLIEKGINKQDKKSAHTYHVYTKSGQTRLMETNVKRLYDDEGEFTGAIYVARDITELRSLEQLNKERQHYLEAILEATPSAILTLDTENNIKEWNRGAEELFHYSREEAVGQEIDKFLSLNKKHVYQEASTITRKVMYGNPVGPMEAVRYTKGGEAIHVIIAGSPIMVDGSFIGVVATYTNISRLKQKEEEVESLLKDKEQLIREVHHRIKNHMNVISSFISLRSGCFDNPEVSGVLEEVDGKISLMGNIYQSLYTSKDVGTVSISSFLDPLLRDIQAAYIDNRPITIRTDIEKIDITSKQALQVGIIITELITNSLKYAFREGEEGEIRISIYTDRKNSGFSCIEVFDNGRGMPPEVIENEEYGFGLTLVKGYTEQFEGTMSIRSKDGTTAFVALKLQ